MNRPPRDSDLIKLLILEEADGSIGLKIPEFAIEVYGEDLPELIKRAEEQLWWEFERSGKAMRDTAKLAIKRVTKEEFGPTYFERQAKQEDWGHEG